MYRFTDSDLQITIYYQQTIFYIYYNYPIFDTNIRMAWSFFFDSSSGEIVQNKLCNESNVLIFLVDVFSIKNKMDCYAYGYIWPTYNWCYAALLTSAGIPIHHNRFICQTPGKLSSALVTWIMNILYLEI